jgi:rSAM/selenodomain-associated transferase 1
MNRALILFFKNPEKGKVKTRLAVSTGEDDALKIYEFLLERTRRTALATTATYFVFYSDFIPAEDGWEPNLFEKHLQKGADLGQRMHHALAFALARFEKAVLIGGDIPGLQPEILETAFRLLDEVPVVWGPAADGGYYLVGLRQANPTLFEVDAWSTPDVLQQSLEKCRQCGLSWHLLPVLEDVDTEDDWRRALAELNLNFPKYD